jgi:hypothetical protein
MKLDFVANMKLVPGLFAILSLVIAGSTVACAPDEREGARSVAFSVPHVSEFPQTYRSSLWTSPPPVEEVIDRALAARGLIYTVTEDGETTRIITAFAPMINLKSPIHLNGLIAMLIAFRRHFLGEPKQEIQIHRIVMERRQLTAQYRVSQDPAVLSAADDFIRSFVEDMQQLAKPPR